jgi:hypothetical protein
MLEAVNGFEDLTVASWQRAQLVHINTALAVVWVAHQRQAVKKIFVLSSADGSKPHGLSTAFMLAQNDPIWLPGVLDGGGHVWQWTLLVCPLLE